jgi:DNA-binding transcriptional MocR family regulator
MRTKPVTLGRPHTGAAVKLYEQLAHEVSSLIEGGILRPGERLPSLRTIERSHKVSAATVMQAYRLLESRSLIFARPRSGYYVSAHWGKLPAGPKVSSPPDTSHLVDVNDLVFAVLQSMKVHSVVPFGSAFIDPVFFPLSQLARFLSPAAKRINPSTLYANFPPGNMELRRAIARRYFRSGFVVQPEEIIITTGAIEALNLCLHVLARPGDTVAIESPTYYAELQALQLLGLRAVELPTHPTEGIELAALAAALRKYELKACWVTTNFQNPLGCVMPEEKKKELVKLLARHEVPLIEDDVYEELYFGADKPKPAKAFDRAGLVLHCSSFSKCLGPGYRVGWATPGRFARQVERMKWMTTLATNMAAQEAMADYLRQGGYDHYLRGVRGALASQRDHMVRAIVRHFPPATRVSRPEGGYFLWVELPRSVSALRVHQLSMENAISIAPGPIFSARRKFENFVRLNYGHVWSPGSEKAVSVLGRLISACNSSHARKK